MTYDDMMGYNGITWYHHWYHPPLEAEMQLRGFGVDAIVSTSELDGSMLDLLGVPE